MVIHIGIRFSLTVLFATSMASADPQSAFPPGSAVAADIGPSAAEELDRPGEVENPFTLLPGTAQLVAYVLAANPPARAAEDLGSGGSATLLQTGLRFGFVPGWEGQLFADTYLNAIDKGPDGDAPGVSRAGLGWVTLRAKVQLFQADGGEDGIALVPFVRIPVKEVLAGQAGAEPGLLVPFNVDLEHGFEIQGSTGVTDGHRDQGGRAADWETQSSLEWHFSPRWALYVEPEVDTGEGPPRWALEEGITCSLTRRIQGDVGLNTGLGKNSGARFVYVGLGFSY